MTLPASSSPTPPRGHAFLELGERLRRRGQLDAAATVTAAGLAHYPDLGPAHDLLGRIRADQHDDAAAAAAWAVALECDQGNVGARKGLAFLAFRGGDLAAAERHLEAAVLAAPHDPEVSSALDRVRAATAPPIAGPVLLDDPAGGIMLFDREGMRLIGGVGPDASDEMADAVAAECAAVVRESVRATRLLHLGPWRQVIVEGPDSRSALFPVADDATLLLVRGASTPVGRVVAAGHRATVAARAWLERMT
ncbi:MAG: roadblock/LC7 domain-containing protein [Gemmatimonadales bacterium]|nr:roadblock/LC7 domain-containing protein [Gemmatimonadales bacterium]